MKIGDDVMALPGFEGRLGRLGFLGRSMALGVMTSAAAGILVLLVAGSGHASPAARLLFGGAIIVPIALYAGLSLQTRRLNDMGWPARPVIAGWFLVSILDVALAHGLPSLARPGGGTILGAAVNVGLALLLLLWPSRNDDDPVSRDGPSEWILPAPHQAGWPRVDAAPRLSPAAGRPASFGRRRA